MPGELDLVQEHQILQDREIRRLRLLMQKIAVSSGIRATAIIGIIPSGNLPSSAAGGTLVYIGFGDAPASGLSHTGGDVTAYTMDLLVKT